MILLKWILCFLPLLLLLLLSIIILKVQVSAVSNLDITIKQQKPWYGMYLEGEKSKIIISIKNKINKSLNLDIGVREEFLGSNEKFVTNTILTNINLDSSPTETNPYTKSIDVLHYSKELWEGQWKLTFNAIDSKNKTVYGKAETFFVVHSLDDLYDNLIAIGGVFSTITAITAVAIQFIYNRKTLNSMDEQRKISDDALESTKKSVALTEKEMDTTLRPWIGVVISDSPMIIYTNKNNLQSNFLIKNFGRIPGKITDVKIKWGYDELSDDISTWNSLSKYNHIIMPNEENLVNDTYQPDRDLSSKYYVGLLIEYQYPTHLGIKIDEFGIVLEISIKKYLTGMVEIDNIIIQKTWSRII
jgi:hypothetical protein